MAEDPVDSGDVKVEDTPIPVSVANEEVIEKIEVFENKNLEGDEKVQESAEEKILLTIENSSTSNGQDHEINNIPEKEEDVTVELKEPNDVSNETEVPELNEKIIEPIVENEVDKVIKDVEVVEEATENIEPLKEKEEIIEKVDSPVEKIETEPVTESAAEKVIEKIENVSENEPVKVEKVTKEIKEKGAKEIIKDEKKIEKIENKSIEIKEGKKEKSVKDKDDEKTFEINFEKPKEKSVTQKKRIDSIISKVQGRINEIMKVIHVESKSVEPKDSKSEDESKRKKEKALGGSAKVGMEGKKQKEVEVESEVGIVGPPTAITEILSDEELHPESTLPSVAKVNDHVARWVHNSRKTDHALMDFDDDFEEEEIPDDDEDDEDYQIQAGGRRRSKRICKKTPPAPTRKSQRVVSNIIRRSIRCLNKMHAMEGGSSGSGKKADSDKHEEDSSKSPKVPQNQQNGAALPEETAVDGLRSTSVKKESYPAVENDAKHPILQSELLQLKTSRAPKEEKVTTGRKRRSMEDVSANGGPIAKKMCFDQQREQYINALIGNEKSSAEELTVRSEQLRADVQALDALARAKEHEWNEILCMRKLKEEAYLRLERRRQVVGFMESNGPTSEALQPVTLTMSGNWERTGSSMNAFGKDKCTILPISKEERKSTSRDSSPAYRKDKVNAKAQARRQASATPPLKQAAAENGRKQADSQSPENRQIGEGRQGPILDVRSIIADYRLRHPETAPKRRGRRMRNSVNVGLGAGGAMVEAGQVIDSRPSSTDSCKSNPNSTDPNSMSFKDVLVQFARLSQQQGGDLRITGEPIKTPQNYPDVTLHPVAPSSVPQNVPQQSGSLLHGILTKSQSPRPTTFSPTLARLLTAPERERAATVVPAQQSTAAAQHLLQTYQGSNPVSISDLLSSSKARTEITITPVVNNNMMHADDIEEESAILEERDSRVSGPRDGREDRDTPPRCQGCHDRAAQFVCAGCGNQWYCSRECQVAAWDDHSEVCSG